LFGPAIAAAARANWRVSEDSIWDKLAAVEKMIEVRYAGAVVGRSAIVRELDTQGMFLGTAEPMPVGTVVTLKMGDQAVQVKVAAVSESPELARAGMRVRFADPASANLFGIPGPAAEPAAPMMAAPVPSAPQAAPPEPSRAVGSGPVASQSSRQDPEPSAPRPVVVDASRESAAIGAAGVPDEAEAAPSVATAVPGNGPPAAGEGGNKKNRRNKRR